MEVWGLGIIGHDGTLTPSAICLLGGSGGQNSASDRVLMKQRVCWCRQLFSLLPAQATEVSKGQTAPHRLGTGQKEPPFKTATANAPGSTPHIPCHFTPCRLKAPRR